MPEADSAHKSRRESESALPGPRPTGAASKEIRSPSNCRRCPRQSTVPSRALHSPRSLIAWPAGGTLQNGSPSVRSARALARDQASTAATLSNSPAQGDAGRYAWGRASRQRMRVRRASSISSRATESSTRSSMATQLVPAKKGCSQSAAYAVFFGRPLPRSPLMLVPLAALVGFAELLRSSADSTASPSSALPPGACHPPAAS